MRFFNFPLVWIFFFFLAQLFLSVDLKNQVEKISEEKEKIKNQKENEEEHGKKTLYILLQNCLIDQTH